MSVVNQSEGLRWWRWSPVADTPTICWSHLNFSYHFHPVSIHFSSILVGVPNLCRPISVPIGSHAVLKLRWLNLPGWGAIDLPVILGTSLLIYTQIPVFCCWKHRFCGYFFFPLACHFSCFLWFRAILKFLLHEIIAVQSIWGFPKIGASFHYRSHRV